MKTKWLEKDKEKFYPVGHAEATLDKNGKTVQSSLDKIPAMETKEKDLQN